MQGEARLTWSNKAVEKAKLPGLRVHVFGCQPSLSTTHGQQRARGHLAHMNHDRLLPFCFVTPPNPKGDVDKRKILLVDPANHQPNLVADATVFTADFGRRFATESRDCPYVVLHNPRTRGVAVVHCMRDYLRRDPETGLDLLTEAVLALAAREEDRTAIVAHITPGISAPFFAHNDDPDKVYSFYHRFGASVFGSITHWTLNLQAVITRILMEMMIPRENINATRCCTASDELQRFGSYRAGRQGQNMVCVVPCT